MRGVTRLAGGGLTVGMAALLGTLIAGFGARPAAQGAPRPARPPMLYVADSRGVTPVNTVTGKASPPIKVGRGPDQIVITPDGRTLYVTNTEGTTISPITVATGKAGHPIRVGAGPFWLVVAPDGKAVYVLSDNSMTAVSTKANQPGRPVRLHGFPQRMAITPNGKTLYVTTGEFNLAYPIGAASGRLAGQSRPGHLRSRSRPVPTARRSTCSIRPATR